MIITQSILSVNYVHCSSVTCIIFVFVFHCTHVRMSYVLNSYLLTYLLTYLLSYLRCYAKETGSFIYGDILRDCWKRVRKKRYIHSTAKIRLTKRSAAVSAIAKLLLIIISNSRKNQRSRRLPANLVDETFVHLLIHSQICINILQIPYLLFTSYHIM